MRENQIHHQEVERSAIAPVVTSDLSDPPSCDNLQETIDWLQSIGLPPLPECPIEAERQGKAAKQPHYLGKNGIAYSVQWKPWQEKQPPEESLRQWFLIPRGIGTLAKFNGQHWITWIDIDRKTFKNNNCDETIADWETRYPILEQCPMFRTPSGGYRYMIALAKEPENFKSNNGFSLSPDGNEHCGELLTKNGGHTLLPPTASVNGSYIWERFCSYPPVIEKPEDVGIYPLKKAEKPKPVINDNQSNSEPKLDDNNNLSSVIEEINSKLDFETAFNAIDHQFQYDGQDKVRGYCPFHDSKSGTAFYAERKSNALLWRCPACDLGGNVITYRSLINGGNGRPRGKEFIDIVKGLCEETGVIFPERSKPKKQNQQDNSANQEAQLVTEDDPNRMKTTPDATVLHSLFESGKGNYKTINDAYYKYDGKGYWQYVEDNKINKLIGSKLLEIYQLKGSGEQVTKEYKYANDRNKSSAFKFCRSVLALDEEPYNEHLLCFLNGTVDLRTGELLPHNREHFLTYAIASKYSPNSNCPEVFRNFITDVFGEELLPLIRAVTAMYLDPTAPYGYFAHLLGASGSGKGTLLRLWGSMFGGNIRSICSFSDIATAEGRHQFLTGSKFISFPDMGGFQGSLKAFYELVDNGSMSGRALYSSSSYERRWNCRFALASVDYLSIENSGDGWDRRCIPLPTKQRRCEVDPDLGRKLQEVKGEIISWALGMNRHERDQLIMNAGKASDRIASLKREQSIYSDSIRAFIDLCLRPSNKQSATVENHRLYDWYTAFCKMHGFKNQSSTKFISHLRNILPHNHVRRRQYRDGGRVINLPAHFAYLEAQPKAFNTLRGLDGDVLQWQCHKEFCVEGGLDAFDEFWATVTAVTASDVDLVTNLVTAGSITTPTVESLSQVSQVSQDEKTVAQKIEQLGITDSSGNHDKIDQKINIEVSKEASLPCDGCDGCDGCQNVEPATTTAVTGLKDDACDDPVTPVTDANPKAIAADAIASLLDSSDANWEVVKSILNELEIPSYSYLEGFMSLGDFKKLDLLVPEGEKEIAF